MHCNYKYSLSFLSLSASFLFSSAQNLVPNPSFEQYDTCPNFYGQLNRAIPWFNPTTASPDYFNTCTPMVPATGLGIQNPVSGNAYAGFFAYYDFPSDYREYLEIQLQNSLLPSIKYYITFYVSLADSVVYGTDAIQAFFSPSSITSGNPYNILAAYQFANTAGNYITDKNNWIQIKGSFIASGGEIFLVIGNFKNNVNTNKVYVGGGSANLAQDSAGAYYYIDDVCVSEDSLTCGITGINEQKEMRSINIFPNPSDRYIEISSENDFIESVEVINTFGKLLFEEKNIRTNSLKLNIEEIQNGVYFIKIYTATSCIVKKIIIRKNIN